LCARSGVSPTYGGFRFGRGAGSRGGYGGGFGPRRGFGRGYYDYPPIVAQQLNPDDELEMLKAEQQRLQQSLEAIGRKIDEIHNEGATP
jgi:hypothetical protein